MIAEPEDHELVNRAQEGDVFAFEELVQRYDRRVLSIALSYTRNTEDAKDIYQEVFLRIYRALPKFRQESQFSTWLFRIATNVCLTHQGRQKGKKTVSLDEEIPTGRGESFTLKETIADKASTDQMAKSEQISQHVNQAMDQLSPQQRIVFSLRHFKGLKLKEIASMMDCAEGTVKKYLFTATERMRAQLKEVYQ